MAETTPYAAGLQIDYPDGPRDRLTVFFRLIWALPVLILYGLLSGGSATHTINQAGKAVETSGGSIAIGLFVATALMLVVRQHYPRWWFDFAVELARFGGRVGSYVLLLTDVYPSTVETQAVHLEIAYPDVGQLNRWLPLVKWLLAIPHYVVLVLLGIAVAVVTIIAWIAILVTGSYPRSLFDFVVGVGRWGTRVWAYAFLLVTDDYPPFSLQ